jgi:hypothetical protein
MLRWVVVAIRQGATPLRKFLNLATVRGFVLDEQSLSDLINLQIDRQIFFGVFSITSAEFLVSIGPEHQ